ncbi:MAG: hypothetical protein AAB267_09395, partial [Candidatus Desantisbacteria bacterium]
LKNAAVRIDFGTHKTITTLITEGNGTFSGTFIVSTQVQGTTVVTVMDLNETNQATILFEILSQIILITPKIDFVGEVITVEGTGYGTVDHLDELIQIDFGTHYTITTTIIDNQNGTFSATFIISSQPYGTKAITVTGEWSDQHEGSLASDHNLYHTAVFYLDARITIFTPTSGNVGTLVSIEGTGFGTVGTLIQIDFGTHISITTTQTSLHGTFSLTFIISTQEAGNTVVTASCDNNLELSTKVFEIRAEITLITPLKDYVNEIITITGRGYTKSGTVSISFGTHQTITTTPTSENGTFSVTFIISSQPYGTKTITVQSLVSPFPQAVTSIFYLDAHIVIRTPPQTFVNEIITITGTGYGTNSRTIQIDFGTKMTITTVMSSPHGTFSTTFRVNSQPYGTKVITVRGLKSELDVGQSEFDTTTFYLDARIVTIAPTTGFVNKNTITLTGTGYGSGTLVQIDFGTHITITTTMSSIHGTFSVTFVVDSQPYGTKTITVSDMSSMLAVGQLEFSTTIFYLDAEIVTRTPDRGFVNKNTITITGTGYGSGSTLQIDFGTHITITTTMSSIHGTFSVTFTVDSQPYGTKTITVTNTQQTGITWNEFSTTTFYLDAQIVEKTPDTGFVNKDIITLTGTGYGSGTTVCIDFGTHQTITTTMSSTNGTFSTTFTVDSQPYGTKVITVTSTSSGQTGINWTEFDTTTFYLDARIVTIAPTTGFVNEDIITLPGTG